MKILLKNAQVYTNNEFTKSNLEITDGKITAITANIPNIEETKFDAIYDLQYLYLLPGLIDVHTHLREPGFIYK